MATITKEMVMNGDLPLEGTIIKNFQKNEVEISYYGGKLSAIFINGRDIEDIFNLPEAKCSDDELCYRITQQAIEHVVQLLNK